MYPWDTVLLKERQFGGSGLVSLTQETVQALVLRAFCDSTGKGTAAAAYEAI